MGGGGRPCSTNQAKRLVPTRRMQVHVSLLMLCVEQTPDNGDFNGKFWQAASFCVKDFLKVSASLNLANKTLKM